MSLTQTANITEHKKQSVRWQQRGYILVATLALLALIALIAGRLASRMDLLREQSLGLSTMADGLLAIESGRAQILFRMATEPVTLFGIGVDPVSSLPVDARPITLSNEVIATLQDHRGLLSLNAPDRPLLMRLLVERGVPANRADHLLDTLADYTDTDSLRRLNGAEQVEYDALGLPPPRNDWLNSAEELRQIIGWRDYPEILDQLIPLLSSRRDGFFNPNSAPRDVLAARLPMASPALLDTFISRRVKMPFASATEARQTTGLPFSEDNDLFHPSDFYRLRLQAKGSSMAIEYNIRLSPENFERPWQIVDSRVVFPPVTTDDAHAKK